MPALRDLLTDNEKLLEAEIDEVELCDCDRESDNEAVSEVDDERVAVVSSVEVPDVVRDIVLDTDFEMSSDALCDDDTELLLEIENDILTEPLTVSLALSLPVRLTDADALEVSSDDALADAVKDDVGATDADIDELSLVVREVVSLSDADAVTSEDEDTLIVSETVSVTVLDGVGLREIDSEGSMDSVVVTEGDGVNVISEEAVTDALRDSVSVEDAVWSRVAVSETECDRVMSYEAERLNEAEIS